MCHRGDGVGRCRYERLVAPLSCETSTVNDRTSARAPSRHKVLAEHLQEVRSIVLSGYAPALISGYLQKPDANVDAFRRSRCFHAGSSAGVLRRPPGSKHSRQPGGGSS